MIKNFIKKVKKSKGGFTLIELIVVVAILAILAAILVPTISGQISKANDSRGRSDANSAYLACAMALTQLENTNVATIDSAAVKTKAADYYKGAIDTVNVGNDSDGNKSVLSVSIKENNTTYTYTDGGGVSVG